MKSVMLLVVMLFALLIPVHSQVDPHFGEKRFGSIVVRSEGGPRCDVFIIDFDNTFAWIAKGVSDSRQVFVYSKPHKHWLQIVEVDTKGATFGHTPFDPTHALQANWNLQYLGSKSSVRLPIATTNFIHAPDKAVYNEALDAYSLYFDSQFGGANADMATILIIPKKDLIAAMDYYKGGR